MVAPVQTPAEETPPKRWLAGRPVLGRLLRWAFIAAVTVLAFHGPLEVLIGSTFGAGVNGYTWVIPLAGIMAAQGVAHRSRRERSIHDRQTDVIVGVMGLSLALMVQGVLLPRYTDFFSLLRLDLAAMLLFVISAGVMLFGLRAVTRFRWVWAMMLLALPLPYHLTVIVLGGGKVAAGITALLIVGAAAAIAFGFDRTIAMLAAIGAWGFGVAYLVVLWVFFPDAPLLVYQLNPSLTSIAAVSLLMVLISRRGPSRGPVQHSEPLAAKDVWWGCAVVLAVGLVLAVLPLPPGSRLPALPQFDGLAFGAPLVAPHGWHVTETTEYDFVKRLYGRNATLVRQKMVADVGNPNWDKFSRPRTVVVDCVSTDWPLSLEVYPPGLLFDVSERLSARRSVDLGHGVAGELLTAVDDHLLLTWNVLEFEWRDADFAQRILVSSVDNHEPDAHFPPPNGAIWKTLYKLLAVLFRGNSVAVDETSSYEDADLLTTFGRDLVEAQLQAVERRETRVPR
ncbi:hypothetical protein [Mycolicibacterium baixiangningiae]|uniref:hypothetical protein n=1 Tax=Mycolicibacterium baixiangningiae TaxID=2761578 RepID=UPI0018667B8D|nr:hypothetical protein [Mycolicibacterium baixiangningiae]